LTLPSAVTPLALVSLGLAAVAAGLDLHEVETHTLVVYTTPALKDFLEKAAIPEFERQTGASAVPVYLSASEEYYRVRMSRDRPEADVFVHASPLYLEKGYMEGVIEPHASDHDLGFGNQSRPVPGGRIWQAFAWSPLVEVYRPGSGPVDLANDTGKFGFAHPLLSNNGIYNVLFFEAMDPAVGRSALDRTVVQPVNAAATIGGVADGSYDLTLGYEAVATLYKGKGANIDDGIPMLAGQNVTTPVLFAAGVVAHHPHALAQAFIESLLSPATQDGLARYGLRPMMAGAPQPKGALDVSGAHLVDFEWSHYPELEAALARYEVKR
jgi:ABC-type molybdate transport system substrate-binding protein